jgi:Tol biopolymer transport system component
MPLFSGDKLGPYEIVAPIGAGGMGEVYRARDTRLGRDVAVKVLPDETSSDPQANARFEREARAVAALSHPNILVLFDVGAHNGIHYAVTELLEGETLQQRLSRSALPWRKAIELGVALAEGLAAAHDKEIVHRDIKPGNIFLANDGQVKILDFGLAMRQPALALGDETVTSGNIELGAVMGTVGYMSPEQARGEKADARSDIFSLGCVLYEAVTGRRPFQGKTAADTLAAILKEDPPAISDTGKQVPAELERVIERCLAKNAAQRFHSAHDLAFALRVLVSASGEKPAAKEAAKVARMRLPIAIGAAVVLLAAGGLTYWLLDRPLPMPRVVGYAKITQDGHEKMLSGTDGSRLFFTQMQPKAVFQVGVAGGAIAQIPAAVPGTFYTADVSPDGSNLLVISQEPGKPSFSLFNVPALGGGSLRRLGIGGGVGFSPDGNSIAYTNQGEMWLVQSDGTGAHKLGSIRDGAYEPHWSPDGSVIRFTRDGVLWEISSTGSNLHQVLPGWRSPNGQCCGHWTPDGKFYLFLAAGDRFGRGQIWALDERRGLFGPPPAEPVRLTPGPLEWGEPIPGKDGKNIFSVGQIRRGELSRFDAQTGQLQPFLGGVSAEDISFSRDGRSVAYASYPEGILWKANRDGSGPLQLSTPPMYAKAPRWSPDGTEIVFQNLAEEGDIKSYLVSPEGGKLRRILPDDNKQEDDPTWSPDGRRVVFDGGPDQGPGSERLRFLDLASHQVTLVPGSAGVSSPRWSPDGRYIAAISLEFEGLKVFDTSTQRWTTLPTNGRVDFPSWSSDSKFIYFLHLANGDRGVYRVRAAGGKIEQVVDLKDLHITGYFSFWMGLDPTDTPLLLRDMGSSDIYALTLEEK